MAHSNIVTIRAPQIAVTIYSKLYSLKVCHKHSHNVSCSDQHFEFGIFEKWMKELPVIHMDISYMSPKTTLCSYFAITELVGLRYVYIFTQINVNE